VDKSILPDNRHDPRFTETGEADVDTDLPWSECGLQWSDVAIAVAEAIPSVIDRLFR
jgi:hypothetical protein